MELRIIKPSFKYVAGQWLFIQVPDVSGFQWHPVRSTRFIIDVAHSSLLILVHNYFRT